MANPTENTESGPERGEAEIQELIKRARAAFRATDSRTVSLTEQITPESYADWLSNQRFAENIRNGKPWLNTPPPIKDADIHSPSQIAQCHRKLYYKQLNAPEERPDPAGIFWTGSQIETELIQPYLESVTGPQIFVRNSIWIDAPVDTDQGELRIRGKTDPVFVDEECEPLLVTEVKTKSHLNTLTEPSPHHVAQLYAYIHGLNHEWGASLDSGLLLYIDRKTLELKPFVVPFDESRWSSLVVSWLSKHTKYREQKQLPPPIPEAEWECTYCPYRERCGRETEGVFQDLPELGFVPFHNYPREKVERYLESHSEARLTPSLATRYPNLARNVGVLDWVCEVCSETVSVGAVSWEKDPENPPLCPECQRQGVPGPLSDPLPGRQSATTGSSQTEHGDDL